MSQEKKYTEDKFFFPHLKSFIRAHKVRYDFLSEEMGYSKVYLSKVFNGHSTPSPKFKKLLILALEKFTQKDNVSLMTLLEKFTPL